jgi:hypothetical protein
MAAPPLSIDSIGYTVWFHNEKQHHYVAVTGPGQRRDDLPCPTRSLDQAGLPCHGPLIGDHRAAEAGPSLSVICIIGFDNGCTVHVDTRCSGRPLTGQACLSYAIMRAIMIAASRVSDWHTLCISPTCPVRSPPTRVRFRYAEEVMRSAQKQIASLWA